VFKVFKILKNLGFFWTNFPALGLSPLYWSLEDWSLSESETSWHLLRTV